MESLAQSWNHWGGEICGKGRNSSGCLPCIPSTLPLAIQSPSEDQGNLIQHPPTLQMSCNASGGQKTLLLVFHWKPEVVLKSQSKDSEGFWKIRKYNVKLQSNWYVGERQSPEARRHISRPGPGWNKSQDRKWFKLGTIIILLWNFFLNFFLKTKAKYTITTSSRINVKAAYQYALLCDVKANLGQQ